MTLDGNAVYAVGFGTVMLGCRGMDDRLLSF